MSLEQIVGDLLITQKKTLALAESCTGGLITHLLTNVPGCSAYMMGSIVAYSYDAKVNLLGVNRDDLVHDGAVSASIASEMARGALAAFGVDVALSVTGIAGPGGATPTKPVGLTYIGLAARDAESVIRRVWTGDREHNKMQSAQAAFQLLESYLRGSLIRE